jgi:HEAT repeats
MASVTSLDTRTAVRSAGMRAQPPDNSSQTQTTGQVFFRPLVNQLVNSSHRERAALRQAVIERIRISHEPIIYIGELLDQCVVGHRSEGIDIAIDVLEHFGSHVIEYARQFLRKDVERWEAKGAPPRHHIHDDIWYVLLRAVGSSGLDTLQKIQMLSYCAADGTPNVREASVRALGDIGSPDALRLIRRQGGTDSSAMVREAAGEVLDDLEG